MSFSPLCPKLLLPLGVLLLLAACWARPPIAANQISNTANPEHLSVACELADSARNIERLWGELNALQAHSSASTSHPAPPLIHTKVLQKRVRVEWAGELHVLLTWLAQTVGYSFRELGRRPALPIYISLHAENISIADALREAGHQAGGQAGVRIHDGRRKLIEAIYQE
ncbi:MAG: DotD/TraH family lipoprotein [Candidatus Eutrophobiaceae bacterium]